jgi:hypothetical protein
MENQHDTRVAEFLKVDLNTAKQDHLRAALQKALQSALELELSTLPPYLCGMWSTADQNGQVATLVSSVVREEMLHMGLACNMLTAIGGAPKITVPAYPSHLPGGVLPDLVVPLQSLSKDYVKDIYMEIEYPEDEPVDRADQSFPKPKKGPTIGQFYDHIQKAFNQLEKLDPKAITPENANTAKQIETHIGEFSVFFIKSFNDVRRAIKEIKEQGEGASGPNAVDEMHVLAHYYRFGEIVHGQGLVRQKDGSWAYTGDPIPFPGVYRFSVPKGGYPRDPATPKINTLLDTFNTDFSTLINDLQSAWETGNFGNAVGDMFTIQTDAQAIIQTKMPGGKEHYGPEFLYVKTEKK